MRILADENISEQVVVRLRVAGQDVRWTKETDRGEEDPNLLELATRERRALITIDTALRLGHYFGMTPEFWINLQTRYDLDVAEHTVRRQIEREIEPLIASP
ncbi:MAG: DUF5615 family PIN-like protein [Gemmatimonadota bacterium]|nr:DUF5615 family PIN-like protein [Gemmatimonadota bacterium]